MEFVVVTVVEGEETMAVKKMNNNNTLLIIPYGSMCQRMGRRRRTQVGATCGITTSVKLILQGHT